MSTEAIIRNFVLRFPMDTDHGLMRACVEVWNRRFEEKFEGVGYFPDKPEIEGYEVADPGGGVLRCYAFYFRADSHLWAQIASSRTLTVDEPVLARQVAY